jgi:O-antigen/teichoic acid export membrane protein
VWRVVSDLIFGLLVLGLVRTPADMWIVPLALVAGEVVGTAALYLRLKMEGRSLALVWDPSVAIPIFKQAAPLVGQILLGLLLYNLDVIFLRVLIGSEAVGHYAAAYMLISFLANIGMVYGLSLLPALAKETEADEAHGERFVSIEMYHTALAHVFTITIPVAVGGMFVAEAIMTVGFGEAYVPSILVLQVLVWVIPVAVFRNVPWSALIVRGRQHLLMRSTFWAVLLNIVLNLVLIPRVGMVGAALATLAAEPLACGLMLYHAQRSGLPILPLRRLIKAGVAVTFMGGVLWWMDTPALLPQVAAGCLSYGVALAALGGLRWKGRLPVLDV